MSRTTDYGSTASKGMKNNKLDAKAYLKSKGITLKDEPSLDEKDGILRQLRAIAVADGAVEVAKTVRSIHSLTNAYDVICDEIIYDLLEDNLYEVKGGRYEPIIKINGLKQTNTPASVRNYAYKIECLLRGDLDFRLRKAMYYMPGYVDMREESDDE